MTRSAVLAIAFLIGCGKKEEPSSPSSPSNPPRSNSSKIPNPLDAALNLKTRSQLRSLQLACRMYEADWAKFPPTVPYDGSANLHYYLGRRIQQRSSYMDFDSGELEGKPVDVTPNPPRRIVDAWNNPVLYRMTDSGPQILSVGPNGTDDGGAVDDLTP